MPWSSLVTHHRRGSGTPTAPGAATLQERDRQRPVGFASSPEAPRMSVRRLRSTVTHGACSGHPARRTVGLELVQAMKRSQSYPGRSDADAHQVRHHRAHQVAGRLHPQPRRRSGARRRAKELDCTVPRRYPRPDAPALSTDRGCPAQTAIASHAPALPNRRPRPTHAATARPPGPDRDQRPADLAPGTSRADPPAATSSTVQQYRALIRPSDRPVQPIGLETRALHRRECGASGVPFLAAASAGRSRSPEIFTRGFDLRAIVCQLSQDASGPARWNARSHAYRDR